MDRDIIDIDMSLIDFFDYLASYGQTRDLASALADAWAAVQLRDAA
ncbi:MAG TPA: hypothetical protein VFR41_06835 [Acidimicrobiia bacterium]|nr:hypothetical protein [Acidimicrobiia bacterium]